MLKTLFPTLISLNRLFCRSYFCVFLYPAAYPEGFSYFFIALENILHAWHILAISADPFIRFG